MGSFQFFCLLIKNLIQNSFFDLFAESRENDGRSPENNLVSCEGKCEKRTEVGGMWFGPRLGRRRRSDPKQETSSDIMALANVLKDTRMAVVMIPGKEETPGCSRSDSRVSKIGKLQDPMSRFFLSRCCKFYREI